MREDLEVSMMDAAELVFTTLSSTGRRIFSKWVRHASSVLGAKRGGSGGVGGGATLILAGECGTCWKRTHPPHFQQVGAECI